MRALRNEVAEKAILGGILLNNEACAEVLPQCRDDYLTKMTAVGPGGVCPIWRQFLDRVSGGDSEMQSYLQRVPI